MTNSTGITRVASVGLLVTLATSLMAAQPAPTDNPTKHDPLRFVAFAVSMPQGKAGTIDIAIERWSTDEERASLIDLLAGASFKAHGQDRLLKALQKITPRVGYIRTANSLGWDIQYAREHVLPDGIRQIVIATDKPVSFLAAARNSRSMDYPFSFVEMRMKPNDKGEGRLLVATAVDVKNGRLELENYGQEPVRLTSITEHRKKP
jgi:hypothetical protein